MCVIESKLWDAIRVVQVALRLARAHTIPVFWHPLASATDCAVTVSVAFYSQYLSRAKELEGLTGIYAGLQLPGKEPRDHYT